MEKGKWLSRKEGDRVNLVSELWNLGIPPARIAELSKTTRSFVFGAVRWLRKNGRAPNLPIAGQVYELAFARFVSLLRSSQSVSPFERTLCAVLREYLNITDLVGFYSGVFLSAEYMCYPLCDDAAEPYKKLCFAVLGRRFSGSNEPSLTFSGWLKTSNLAPQNETAVRVAILRLFFGDAERREGFAPVWPEGVPDFVDSVLQKHLTPRELRVIQMLYGLREEKRSVEVIGMELCVTQERIRLIEAKAMKKLRRPEAQSDLLRLVRGGTAELRMFLREQSGRAK